MLPPHLLTSFLFYATAGIGREEPEDRPQLLDGSHFSRDQIQTKLPQLIEIVHTDMQNRLPTTLRR